MIVCGFSLWTGKSVAKNMLVVLDEKLNENVGKVSNAPKPSNVRGKKKSASMKSRIFLHVTCEFVRR